MNKTILSIILLLLLNIGTLLSNENIIQYSQFKKRKNINIIPQEKIEGAIGFIVISEMYKSGDSISIFNSRKTAITKKVIDEDNEIIALKCISIDTLFYKVLTNDKKTGYIRKNDRKIKFQTWAEHLLYSVFSVDFNPNINSLKAKPNNNATIIPYDKNEYYQPIKIQGDWLQVKWGNNKKGWIKWKKQNSILIDIYYFA